MKPAFAFPLLRTAATGTDCKSVMRVECALVLTFDIAVSAAKLDSRNALRSIICISKVYFRCGWRAEGIDLENRIDLRQLHWTAILGKEISVQRLVRSRLCVRNQRTPRTEENQSENKTENFGKL